MVYIDNANIPYRGMIMCHMLADTRQELVDMATSLGIKTRYIQKPFTRHEHFDICISKKKKAIQLGAKAINRTELKAILIKRKELDNTTGKSERAGSKI